MDLQEFLRTFNASESDIIEYKSELECIEAVKQNGYALRYIKEQSEAVCIEAVKQNGCALQYVKEQSEAVCIEAVKQDRYALRYINKKTFKESLMVKLLKFPESQL